MEIKKDLFTRLQRLFSTDVLIRNTGGNQLKTVDINKIQQSGEINTNSLVDRFQKLYTNSGTSQQGLYKSHHHQNLRPNLYSEYDSMDTDGIISSVLDIIADECTLKNDFGELLSIKSNDDDIKNILSNLFYDILNIEFNLWPWIRSMCKYGDFFLKLEISDKHGVYNVIPFTAYQMERLEGIDPENPSDVYFKYHPEGITASPNYGYSQKHSNDTIFDNYEISHFRLLSDMNFLPYGRSYVEPARNLFKQYVLMEDAMLIHRIVRAPEKRIFYLNIGSIPPNEVENFMQQSINAMKRSPHIDPETGEYNLKYNVENLMEDYYIPHRGGDTSTKIDTLGGLQYDGIQDVEYLRDKLFAALKVPKAFMGYDENTDGKATLAAQDVRFARTIERIQSIVLSELHKIAIVHLYSQGYTDEGLINFDLSLTTPSIIYDQERIELLKSKTELSAQLQEQNIVPTDWIYENIFRFSEKEYQNYRELILQDAERKFRYTQLSEEGNDPKITGESYGTAHDLAAMYDRNRMDSSNVPSGYDEDKPLGRPKKNMSSIGTQNSSFGKDPLGRKGMKNDDNSKGNMNLENQKRSFIQNLPKIDPNKKKMIYEILSEEDTKNHKENDNNDILDENNINQTEF